MLGTEHIINICQMNGWIGLAWRVRGGAQKQRTQTHGTFHASPVHFQRPPRRKETFSQPSEAEPEQGGEGLHEGGSPTEGRDTLLASPQPHPYGTKAPFWPVPSMPGL